MKKPNSRKQETIGDIITDEQFLTVYNNSFVFFLEQNPEMVEIFDGMSSIEMFNIIGEDSEMSKKFISFLLGSLAELVFKPENNVAKFAINNIIPN